METISLKKYRVMGKLGQGGMGVVYLAEDLTLGRRVALKFLAPYLVRDQEIMKRFRAEARSHARLVHPHITLVYAFEEVGDQAFLVLEYVDGDSLEDKIKSQGRIVVPETVVIFSHILSAMDYAHQRGVIHRDLKPGNIGFTREGAVKLMDFGIALNVEEKSRLTRTGHIVGTPHYMAPEQILGRPVDSRTDIYALGITLFEMVTGHLPFEGDSDYAVSVAQVNEPPPSLLSFGFPDITPSLEAVVLKALAKSPEERFGSAREFLQALKASISQKEAPTVSSKLPAEGYTQVIDRPVRHVSSGAEPEVAAGPVVHPAARGMFWRWAFILLPFSLLVSVAVVLLFRFPGFWNWLRLSDSPQPQVVKSSDIPPPQEKASLPVPSAHPDSMPDKKSPITAKLLPPQPKLEALEEKRGEQVDVLQTVKEKLKEKGFAYVKVSMDKNNKLIIAGEVKSYSDKKKIIEIAKAVCAGFPLEYGKLTVAKKVSLRPKRKEVVREEALPVPAIPRKPLPPKLDQGDLPARGSASPRRPLPPKLD